MIQGRGFEFGQVYDCMWLLLRPNSEVTVQGAGRLYLGLDVVCLHVGGELVRDLGENFLG
jgi:hypothetical protein